MFFEPLATFWASMVRGDVIVKVGRFCEAFDAPFTSVALGSRCHFLKILLNLVLNQSENCDYSPNLVLFYQDLKKMCR